MSKPFERKTYLALALDPVYVGTGGYRLGRVDNTIIREPGTNIPKIPGSSIAGVARAYTAMAVQSENPGKQDKAKYQRKEGDEYKSCAGKGGEEGESHCGEPDCEVCIPFGFSKGRTHSSFQGLAQFFDARILLFPVHSMLGPVWVTCPFVLKEFGERAGEVGLRIDSGAFFFAEDCIWTDLVKEDEKLNLGWIYLKNKKNKRKKTPLSGEIPGLGGEILKRTVLVSDRVFSRVVNDNLEVRTSVAISPATGAAEEGALYTYEAIPRATLMWFDVVYNNPKYFGIGREPINKDINWVRESLEKGLNYFQFLGIGGMNTRGMGRVKILNLGG